jgi:hypothetical protein
MSCHIALGDVAFRRTRHLYQWVAGLTKVDQTGDLAGKRLYRAMKIAWDVSAALSEGALRELRYWRDNIRRCRPAPIDPLQDKLVVATNPVLASDTGDTGFGGIVCSDGDVRVATGHLDDDQQQASSSVRELLGVYNTLAAFEGELAAVRGGVLFFVDNTAAVRALSVGSMNSTVNAAAEKVHDFCDGRGIRLLPRWSRRCNVPIRVCDLIGRMTRRHDHRLSAKAFNKITRRLGDVDTDLFATAATAKCDRFVSRFTEVRPNGSRCIAVDAFAHRWDDPKIGRFYAYPPWAVIPRAIEHARATRGHGIFVLPFSGAQRPIWWKRLGPLRKERCVHIRPKEADVHLRDAEGAFSAVTLRDEQGRACSLIAVAVDFRH